MIMSRIFYRKIEISFSSPSDSFLHIVDARYVDSIVSYQTLFTWVGNRAIDKALVGPKLPEYG